MRLDEQDRISTKGTAITDKLHCPFCGAELYNDTMTCNKYCGTDGCILHFITIPLKVWQALIDGKAAQDALLFISNIRGGGMSYQAMFLDAHAIAKYVLGQNKDLILVGRYTKDQMEQIASITKQSEE